MKRAGDAFVIWLDSPAAPPGADAPLHGLVEHIPTTTRLRFVDADELLAFVRASRRTPAADVDPTPE